MNIRYLSLIGLLVLGGCRMIHPLTNYDYMQSHNCVFYQRYEQNYMVEGGIRRPSGTPATAYLCDPDKQFVEVHDDELPKGVQPMKEAPADPHTLGGLIGHPCPVIVKGTTNNICYGNEP